MKSMMRSANMAMCACLGLLMLTVSAFANEAILPSDGIGTSANSVMMSPFSGLSFEEALLDAAPMVVAKKWGKNRRKKRKRRRKIRRAIGVAIGTAIIVNELSRASRGHYAGRGQCRRWLRSCDRGHRRACRRYDRECDY